MDDFKEFQGKNIDVAISEACAYFNTNREKLEIEIVQDAKTGIFGIVGSRKAIVKARRAQMQEAVSSILAQTTRKETTRSPLHRATTERNRQGTTRSARRTKQKTDPTTTISDPQAQELPLNTTNLPFDEDPFASEQDAAYDNQAPQVKPSQPKTPKKQPKRKSQTKPEVAPKEILPKDTPKDVLASDNWDLQEPATNSIEHPKAKAKPKHLKKMPQALNLEPEHDQDPDDDLADFFDGLVVISNEELQSPNFKALLDQTLKTLIGPIVGENVLLTVQTEESRVYVHIASKEDASFLVGRDGQTLLAVQYVAARILTHKLGKIVHLQLDAGEYRDRQKDKIKDMALTLAKKARSTGRTYSTKPLSSYNRRLVHLALQDLPDIQTKSIGNGPLKRVAVIPKRQMG